MSGAALMATGGAVCVTGMGWTTALGDDIDGVWRRLVKGDSGIRELAPDARGRPRWAATLPGAGGPATERQVSLAASTASLALADAGCGAEAVDVLVLGSSLGPHLDDACEESPHAWASAAGERLGVRESPVVVSTACSSGSDALLVAAAMISTGAARRCVAGGIDLLSEAKLLGHAALGTASTTGIRPFAEDRDGTVLGEGAGFLVLEARADAEARGARVWGELRGWGSSNDATGPTAPDSSGGGAVLAVERALRKAGVTADEVAVINAHGTGTPANDATESACYATLFGDRPVLSATKPAFGHTLGATGAIEAIALLLSLHHKQTPPMLPSGAALPVDGPVGISVTLGFGGFNTCLVAERAR
ncbi:beta-ketoacyl synthase N-terminal-like domain-containing protein [Allokutzneria oryzae]|uniref:Beta-ketoacyl synthase N-terminal-like domain-containing protein n=1 Tax=Allokutzneria oryzae TaxID=1378989 RepID=A0ABV5ZN73_9PSEU